MRSSGGPATVDPSPPPAAFCHLCSSSSASAHLFAAHDFLRRRSLPRLSHMGGGNAQKSAKARADALAKAAANKTPEERKAAAAKAKADSEAVQCAICKQGFMVTAKVKQLRGRDAMNDNRVEELQKKRDADAERFEREQAESRRGGSAAGVTKFLSEALSTKESSELLRKANLRSGKVGRHAGLGYVLEEYTTENGISVGQTESEEGAAEEEKQ